MTYVDVMRHHRAICNARRGSFLTTYDASVLLAIFELTAGGAEVTSDELAERLGIVPASTAESQIRRSLASFRRRGMISQAKRGIRQPVRLRLGGAQLAEKLHNAVEAELAADRALVAA
jgi:hypothetical protein